VAVMIVVNKAIGVGRQHKGSLLTDEEGMRPGDCFDVLSVL